MVVRVWRCSMVGSLLPLRDSLTPKVVRVLRGRGFSVGKSWRSNGV